MKMPILDIIKRPFCSMCKRVAPEPLPRHNWFICNYDGGTLLACSEICRGRLERAIKSGDTDGVQLMLTEKQKQKSGW